MRINRDGWLSELDAHNRERRGESVEPDGHDDVEESFDPVAYARERRRIHKRNG